MRIVPAEFQRGAGGMTLQVSLVFQALNRNDPAAFAVIINLWSDAMPNQRSIGTAQMRA